MKITCLICLISISSLFILFAQTNDSIYQQYLLNNQNIPKRVYYTSDVKNIIKTDISSIMDGIFPVIWEHRFTDAFGIDGGIGLIMPYSIVNFFGDKMKQDFAVLELLGFNPAFNNNKYGTALHIEPRLFHSSEGLYIGSNGKSFISCTYNLKYYSKLNIREIGVGYGMTGESDKMSLQLIISFFMVTQTAHYDTNDFKYIDSFSYPNGLTAKNLRGSIALQIGLNMKSNMKPIK